MRLTKNPVGRWRVLPWRCVRLRGARALACIVAAVALTGAAQSVREEAPAGTSPAVVGRSVGTDQTAVLLPRQPGAEVARAERKRQVAAQSALLLKLATDLKAEVDKTDKDTLSLDVIRKAGEIEKLARDVKGRMKSTVGAD